ncbi:MAG: acyloxyacyl hydrolase [Nitrospiraceae bacterium]|nr:MAG: acyloxyacyl hydrolase [Nitrospiraceae bacterium]
MLEDKMRHLIFAALTFLIFSFSARIYAEEKKPATFSNAKSHRTILGGYGQTHRNLGDTHVRVQQSDLILQYGHFLTEEAGKSWYKVRHEILIELPFSYVFHPDDGIMTGINFLACWDFTATEKIVPYIFAGGGLVYTNIDVSGLGSDYNGNYQGGIGIHYLIHKNTALDFNYRLHHISNANTVEPNDPLNSSKFLLGITLLK